MERSSKAVTSNQAGVHPGLGRLVARHRQTAWQKPGQQVDAPALEQLDRALACHEGPLILDSFCGTGKSTAVLGERFPHALVVGIDKSAQRLTRSGPTPTNCLLLRAHCEAVWRHLAEKGVTLERHYALYPNPWPKAAHVGRRIHGHPAFCLLPSLGGTMELRTNWRIYAEECGIALHLLGFPARIAWVDSRAEPLTRFEEKYRRSGHELWQLIVDFTREPFFAEW